MTDDRLPLAELAAKSANPDFLRAIAESVLQLIMEADVDGLIGAGRYERGEARQTWRNGYRDRTLDTRLGTMNLKILKMRTEPVNVTVPPTPFNNKTDPKVSHLHHQVGNEMSLWRWNACRYPVLLHRLKAMCPGRVPKDDK
jgi:hypothetical protein